MTTATTKTELERTADELAAREMVVETNDGTYGGAEAVRKCGTADPAFATYRVYERVGDGKQRRIGASPEHAPGYARCFKESINEAREELARLRAQIKAAK